MNKEGLTKTIARDMILFEAMEIYYKDTIFPHMKAVFEQCFTNVTLENAEVLPFSIGSGSKVIVAKNPKR